MQAWLNGEFVPAEQVKISPLCHGFSRGASVFEVAKIVSSSLGPAVLCLDEHIERFYTSCEMMGFEPDLTHEDLKEAILATARLNNVTDGVCKWFAWYNSCELYAVPKDKTLSIAIYCANDEEFGFVQANACAPVAAAVSSYLKLPASVSPFKAKVTGHYVNAYLAAIEANEKGFQDPLLLDMEGYVTEGPTHTLFWVKDGALFTTPLHRVLAGTTRRVLMAAAREIGLEVMEKDIKPEEMADFDEAFGTGSLATVIPIESIDGHKLGDACPGPISTKIAETYLRILKGELPAQLKWLTPLDSPE